MSSGLQAANNRTAWDPTVNDCEQPSQQCLFRVRREIADLNAHPLPGAFVAADEQDLTRIHALVVGPGGTPYEGGFFYYMLKCPPDYPVSPPRARLMTTDAGLVKFSPNFEENGKICLSILGTGPGPAWSQYHGLGGVLLSFQSLMTVSPYRDEPGYEAQNQSRNVSRYDAIILHETIRVAVCDQVEACLRGTSSLPPTLREQVLLWFPGFCDKYEQAVGAHLHLTGSEMTDPYGDWRGVFQYETLLERLQNVKEGIAKRSGARVRTHT
ncbi:hypothetical protein V5799_029009 [Amblyomma americanum]|uniref:Ubiquitin-conjugating enzyme E2 Z n=1 Tax=Amblyomma americanum TaxID=6943 RepID=A0AAQ4ESE6_AMBAM